MVVHLTSLVECGVKGSNQTMKEYAVAMRVPLLRFDRRREGRDGSGRNVCRQVYHIALLTIYIPVRW